MAAPYLQLSKRAKFNSSLRIFDVFFVLNGPWSLASLEVYGCYTNKQAMGTQESNKAKIIHNRKSLFTKLLSSLRACSSDEVPSEQDLFQGISKIYIFEFNTQFSVYA